MDDYQELPYFLDLLQIRYFMQETFGGSASMVQDPILTKTFQDLGKFPRRWCAVTSGLVARVTGLEIVVGMYPAAGALTIHTFNRDSQRNLYVDLTEDQFDPDLSVINVHTAATLKPTVDLQVSSVEILERVGYLSGLLYNAFRR